MKTRPAWTKALQRRLLCIMPHYGGRYICIVSPGARPIGIDLAPRLCYHQDVAAVYEALGLSVGTCSVATLRSLHWTSKNNRLHSFIWIYDHTRDRIFSMRAIIYVVYVRFPKTLARLMSSTGCSSRSSIFSHHRLYAAPSYSWQSDLLVLYLSPLTYIPRKLWSAFRLPHLGV